MKIKYTNAENTHVAIAADDVDFKIWGVTQSHHQWKSIVQPFLDAAGVIEAYQE